MKILGTIGRDHIFFIVSFAHVMASAQLVSAIETEMVSADLATLVQSGGSLSSSGGDFRFGSFVLDQMPSGTAAPNLAQIVLTVDHGSLLWEIGADRRILRAAEDYQLGIKFQVTAPVSQQVLTSATLDIAGATIGTKGDADAQLAMEILNNDGSSLGSLSVVEASGGRHLIDIQNLRGPSQWMARLQIRAFGGTGTAALVLTDVQTSFTTIAIPGPCTLAYPAISAGLLALVARQRGSVPPLR
jgi:hypothetical protein